jgi:tRNA1(Val) A37 N6-methylase TrmN6
VDNFYTAISSKYENSLTDTHKKNCGIFYTDAMLAKKIFYTATKNFNKHAIVMDPCCGTGIFLHVAAEYGYKHAYGIDIDADAIKIGCANIPDAKFIVDDFLGKSAEQVLSRFSLSQKADCVIGNPPYVPITGSIKLDGENTFKRKVSDYGNNFFVAALIRSFDMLKNGGVLSYIIPKNFFHVASYSKLRREILANYSIRSIVDIGIYFKNVRGEQIILTVVKKKPQNGKNKIEMRRFDDDHFNLLCKVPQNFFTDEILLFDCDRDREVFSRLNNTYRTLNDYKSKTGYIGRGKSISENAITGNDIRKFGFKERSIPKNGGNQIFIQNIYSAEAGIIAAYGGNLDASQTVTVFTDSDPKMCRFILGILHSRLSNFFLYRYCFNRSRLTMHADAKYLKKIPLPSFSDDNNFTDNFNKILPIVSRLESVKYLSKKWFKNMECLNKAVYKLFGIDSDLIEYIDREVRKFQSKRWNYFE